MPDPRLQHDINANFFSDKYALIDQASDTVVYYGYPVLDADADDPKCAIAKMETTGNVTTLKWADGSQRREILWSERAGRTYHYLKSS